MIDERLQKELERSVDKLRQQGEQVAKALAEDILKHFPQVKAAFEEGLEAVLVNFGALCYSMGWTACFTIAQKQVRGAEAKNKPGAN